MKRSGGCRRKGSRIPHRLEHRQAAKRAAADIEGHSAAAELSQPGRLSGLLLGRTRARATAPVYFVRMGKGFIRQIGKGVRGAKTLLAGNEYHRE
jgi:hypothetical protein